MMRIPLLYPDLFQYTMSRNKLRLYFDKRLFDKGPFNVGLVEMGRRVTRLYLPLHDFTCEVSGRTIDALARSIP